MCKSRKRAAAVSGKVSEGGEIVPQYFGGSLVYQASSHSIRGE